VNTGIGSVVIVGGGLAGHTLADALRGRGFAGRITLIEREPAVYDRPPLSKAALAEDFALENIAFATTSQLEQKSIQVLTGRTVVGLDGGAQLDDGTIVTGDALVLATGGRARTLPFTGHDAPLVHTLRTFDDAVRIRRHARAGCHVLVVGAGLIGAELTSSLRNRGARVTLIDPVEIPLVPAAGEAFARLLHAMHADNGAEVRVGTVREVIAGSPGEAVLDDGTRLSVDAVVVGAGILPNVELARSAGLPVEDGIIVDHEHRVIDGIYAIGDVARTRGHDGELRRRHEHWEAAQLDALELAAILVGDEPEPRGAAWWWSDRYGVHVEGVGQMTGNGETVMRGNQAAFHLVGDQLVGAVSLDDPMTVRAARRLIDQHIPVSAAVLADPSVPLRSLLRAAR